MKKLFTLFVAILCMFSFVGIEAHSAINKKINANIKTKTVPAGELFKEALKVVGFPKEIK